MNRVKKRKKELKAQGYLFFLSSVSDQSEAHFYIRNSCVKIISLDSRSISKYTFSFNSNPSISIITVSDNRTVQSKNLNFIAEVINAKKVNFHISSHRNCMLGIIQKVHTENYQLLHMSDSTFQMNRTHPIIPTIQIVHSKLMTEKTLSPRLSENSIYCVRKGEILQSSSLGNFFTFFIIYMSNLSNKNKVNHQRVH